MDALAALGSFIIGISAGFRSMTPLAIISLAAHLGWITFSSGPLSIFAHIFITVVLTAWAGFELIMDKTSLLGNRTERFGMVFRIVTGSLSGAAIGAAAGSGILLCAALSLAGAIAGTYGGFYGRKRAVELSPFGDLPVAIIEDLAAIGLAVLSIWLSVIG